jgi:putative membrane protein
MTTGPQHPEPGSKSETASAIRDTAGGMAGKAMASTAISIDAFAEKAMVATLYELEAAEIALRRSSRDDVKQFAQRMLDDHGKMKSELGSFLGATESPTSPPDHVDKLHQVLLDDLAGASDADFDHRYIQQQKLAHSEALTLFKTYADFGKHLGLENLCRLALPVLEEHARLAEQLDKH